MKTSFAARQFGIQSSCECAIVMVFAPAIVCQQHHFCTILLRSKLTEIANIAINVTVWITVITSVMVITFPHA